jgi:hypothetical protein
MKKVVLSTLVLFTITAALGAPRFVSADHPSIGFTTIAQGEVSFYRFLDPGFTGADLRIRDQVTWAWFWDLHTSGLFNPPPLPSVNFSTHEVIATVMGIQGTGGGPNIEVLEIETPHECSCLRVVIQDDETPGPLDTLTNPFHIVKISRQRVTSVVFEHQAP